MTRPVRRTVYADTPQKDEGNTMGQYDKYHEQRRADERVRAEERRAGMVPNTPPIPSANPFLSASDLIARRIAEQHGGMVAGAGVKPSNPKDAIGSDKLPLHLWPTTATVIGALALLDGAAKYGRSNWRDAGVRAMIYTDALERHMAAWKEGEDIDPDSNIPHLGHALACLAILVDAQAHGKLVDDRQYVPAGEKSAWRVWMAQWSPMVGWLKAKHSAHPAPKHWTHADNA